jgi:hypothetical protein
MSAGPSRRPAIAAALVGVLGLALALGRGGLLGWVFALFLLLAARIWTRPRAGDARRVAKSLAAVFAGLVLLVASMVALWETEEVMVLRQLDEEGEAFETRLWVIDLDGVPSFAGRVPAEQRRIALLEKHPQVEMIRGGRSECRLAELVTPDERLGREAQRLYAAKYGFRVAIASRLIVALIGGGSEENPVIVRLLPCEGSSASGGEISAP